MKNYIVAILVVIAVVLLVAWFVTPGEHFKSVASVCYGFLIGWPVCVFSSLLRLQEETLSGNGKIVQKAQK